MLRRWSLPLYKRIVRARITPPDSAIPSIIGQTINRAGLLGGSLDFVGLKMEFQIEKTESSDPNKCNLTIHNLNKNTRNLINVDKTILQLYAGYQQDAGEELLFTGNITLVNNDITRPNIMSYIEANDGELKLNTTRLSVAFSESVTIYQILIKVIDAFGLPIQLKKNIEFTKNIKYNNGSSFTGKAKDLMNLLSVDVGLTWSIQNGELKFYKNDTADTSIAVLLNSESGLINSPKRIKIKQGTRIEKKEIDGWEIVSLLQPKIEPGSTIKITSKEIPENSQFKVVNVKHSGDSLTGHFQSIMEVVQL